MTDAAGKGALHAMRPHVNVEGTLLREALAADGALERSHARVHHHVLQQIVAQRERPPADAALMRLLTCKTTNGSVQHSYKSSNFYLGRMNGCLGWVAVSQGGF